MPQQREVTRHIVKMAPKHKFASADHSGIYFQPIFIKRQTNFQAAENQAQHKRSSQSAEPSRREETAAAPVIHQNQPDSKPKAGIDKHSERQDNNVSPAQQSLQPSDSSNSQINSSKVKPPAAMSQLDMSSEQKSPISQASGKESLWSLDVLRPGSTGTEQRNQQSAADRSARPNVLNQNSDLKVSEPGLSQMQIRKKIFEGLAKGLP